MPGPTCTKPDTDLLVAGCFTDFEMWLDVCAWHVCLLQLLEMKCIALQMFLVADKCLEERRTQKKISVHISAIITGASESCSMEPRALNAAFGIL